jgi:hypothetical protein
MEVIGINSENNTKPIKSLGKLQFFNVEAYVCTINLTLFFEGLTVVFRK